MTTEKTCFSIYLRRMSTRTTEARRRVVGRREPPVTRAERPRGEVRQFHPGKMATEKSTSFQLDSVSAAPHSRSTLFSCTALN